MSEHTPGPWEAVEFTEHTGEQTMRIVDVDGYGIPRGEGPIGETYSRTLGIPDETAKANAHLIAAAPELLKALAKCLDMLDEIHMQHPEMKWSESIQATVAGRAAIRKAKGGGDV